MGKTKSGDSRTAPKDVEFWNDETTDKYVEIARSTLPHAKIGISVLYGEDYSALSDALGNRQIDYVELNWKYALRGKGSTSMLAESFGQLVKDLEHFRSVFANLPAFLKIPREAHPFFEYEDFIPILDTLCNSKMGAIVSNTARWRVPPSKHRRTQHVELSSGVVMGETLFLDTFTALRNFATACVRSKNEVPVVASGGLTEIGNVIDALVAGAMAVQICTAMDHRGMNIVAWLREQLLELVGTRDLQSSVGGNSG